MRSRKKLINFPKKGYGYFIGGSDIDTEGQWIWEDGSKFEYTHWTNGAPSNTTNDDCIYLFMNDNGYWDDIHCDTGYYGNYMCSLTTGRFLCLCQQFLLI